MAIFKLEWVEEGAHGDTHRALGGGGWSACNDNGGDKGGDAGGIIFLISGGNIKINSTVSSNGASGTTNCEGRMGGGRGSGGAIRLLLSGTLTLGTVNVKAIGGSVVGSSAAGGAGGVGRIATLSSATIVGTSNPSIDTSSTETITTIDPFAAALPPTVTTTSATSGTSISATLSGTVNANGLSTTAWFNYGITSGTYTGTSTTQSVSGSSNTSVSSDISGLSSNTTYYYRIAASNSAGTSYGSEASFTTSSAPTPTPTPTPTDTTAPIITITSPTSSDTYTTISSPLNLGGSASDSTSGISSVTWASSKGGSGAASGTTHWSISNMSLSSGDNVITVTATDNAGNPDTGYKSEKRRAERYGNNKNRKGSKGQDLREYGRCQG